MERPRFPGGRAAQSRYEWTLQYQWSRMKLEQLANT
jgi:hypothetical protein